ncbi:MAG TPA: cation:proton antiporter [Polyangia bacterium]|jgi:CPA2 family monovalent cation:H+ antiporter-2|nr:cation:proton antiporter [Polyangia bacterium]
MDAGGAVTAFAVATGGNVSMDILTDLAVILCVAAVTTVIFQRIRQPVVLGYLLAGLIVGPHVPLPLFADLGMAHMLSELGVILLMFSLGLEFSLRKLVRVGPTAGIVAVVQCSLMIWLGYITGRLFGWTAFERLFAGAVVAISSTTIIVKAFTEQGIKGKLSEIVFGILIVEDLLAILLLAILTAAASGAGLSAGALAVTLGRLAGFLVGLLVVGMFIVPRLIRFLVKLGRTETTVVAVIGICFASALLARRFGYSVALGAFLGGALVSESGEGKTIERLIEPVRDIFAAVFFVSVGMLIDPALVMSQWLAVVVLTVVVVVGKVVGVAAGAFLAGNGVRTSVQAGMSLAQIGEFSFIIAAVGMSLGVIGDFLYPTAVAVSALTTLLTPFLIRLSGPVASYVDRRLPHALQTYASLYGSWVQRLRATPTHRTAWSQIRRLAAFLLVDVGAIAAIIVGASYNMPRLVALAGDTIKLGPDLARVLVIIGALLVASPFLLGAVRIARGLGRALVLEAFPQQPSGGGGVDLAAASRRALLVTFQLAILIIAAVPLLAVTQPFLPTGPALAMLITLVLVLAIPLWQSAANLQGHVRAGAQVIVETLSAQSHDGDARQSRDHPVAVTSDGSDRMAGLTEVAPLMSGMGEPSPVRLPAAAPCLGKTLKQLDLRGLTGATVIAIELGPGNVVFPTGDEVLREGQTLVLTGTMDAVAAARDLLGLLGSAQSQGAGSAAAGLTLR